MGRLVSKLRGREGGVETPVRGVVSSDVRRSGSLDEVESRTVGDLVKLDVRMDIRWRPIRLDVIVEIEPLGIRESGRTSKHRVVLRETGIELDVSLLGFFEES